MGEIAVWAILVAVVSISLLLIIKHKRGKSADQPFEMMGIIGITIIGLPLLTYGVVSWLKNGIPFRD